MKKSKIAITVFLVVLMCAGWISQLGNTVKSKGEHQYNIQNGDVYYEKGLYQKAIQSYQSAIATENNKELYEKWLESFRMSYMDGTSTKDEYADALLTVCESSFGNEKHWESLFELHIEYGDYKSAYSIINKCINSGVKSEKLSDLINDVAYSYTASKKNYSKVFRAANGYFTVCDDENWGVLNPAGEWLFECAYSYASPISEELYALFTASNGNRVIDGDGIVQAIISQECTDSNAYGNGFLPIKIKNEKWQYYSCDSDKFVFEQYEFASAFQSGTAVVKEKGKWNFINSKGEVSKDKVFDDVKLYGNGAYSYGGLMVASQNGKYALYNSEGEKETKNTYKNMDIYLGEYIAFEDSNGKWGFIDESGEIVIEPVFSNAKSFSNGLAAVSDGSKWGFINQKGVLVIDYQFEDADYFTNQGVCFVSSFDNSYHMITLRFN